jgi:hypothetical protein
MINPHNDPMNHPHVRCDILEERFKQAGIEYPETVWLYHLLIGPRGEEVVSMMLDVLPKLTHERVISRLVGHLWYAPSSFNGTNLTVVFDNSDSDMVKHKIANDLFQLKAQNIDDWVLLKLREEGEGDYRATLAMFCYMSPRRDEYRGILVDTFEEFPLSCAYALAEIGTAEEIDFLKGKLDQVDDYPKDIRTTLRQYLKRAVSKTEKRIAKMNKPPKKAKQ